MSDWEAIATAASTVEDVHVTPHYRQTVKAGQGFVALSQIVRSENDIDLIGTFEVYIACPQDLGAANKWLMTNAKPVIAALEREMTVLSAEPQSVIYPDATNLNAFVITGARAIEQE